MVAFAGELRFREQQGDGGTRKYLSAVGHIEFLNGRGKDEATEPEPSASASAPDDIPS